MTRSIFKNAGTDLRELLTNYGPDEILYASIDVAKYNHSFMVVNFFGEIIIPKFDIPYNNHGIDFLRKKLDIAQKQTHARKLFLGLESTGHYHENLDNNCPEYHAYYSKKRYQYQDVPGKARTATANKFIKLAFSMMKNETLYYPRTINPLVSEKDYYQSVLVKMKKKLTPYLSDEIPRDNYLTKVQHQLEELYGINT